MTELDPGIARTRAAADRLFHARRRRGDRALGSRHSRGHRPLLPGSGRRDLHLQAGGGGVVADPSGRGTRIPAFEVDTIDTTGCGDSYCAGFVAGLARGFDVEEACYFAAATAALVSTGLGSDASVQSIEATLDARNTLEARTNS